MFRPGDRVRRFETRGGWVVALRFGLRVVFPDLTIEYLDFCEPDEDGSEWLKGRCAECNQEHRNWKDALCVNCGEERPEAPAWLKTWLSEQWRG